MKTQDLAKIAKRQCHLNFVGQELCYMELGV